MKIHVKHLEPDQALPIQLLFSEKVFNKQMVVESELFLRVPLSTQTPVYPCLIQFWACSQVANQVELRSKTTCVVVDGAYGFSVPTFPL